MAAAPFGTLFSASLQFCSKNRTALLAGIVVFGLLHGGIYAMTSGMASRIGNPMDFMGMDAGKLEELQQRMESGDMGAQEDFMRELQGMAQQFEGMSEDDIEAKVRSGVIANVAAAGIMTGGSVLLLTGILTLFASAYYMWFALAGSNDPGAVARGSLKYVLPLAGVGLWTFLRSFIWIPFIGIFFALYFGPRMALAPVLLIKEGKGIMESVTESISRTSGYWGKIFGNTLLAGLLCLVAMMVVGMLILPLSFVPGLGPVLQGIVAQASMVFMTVFVVQLSLSVMANPLVRN